MSKLQDFQVIKKIGDGAFAEVLQVKRKSDGALYAMKKVKIGKLSLK
jgi:NIMA (never in mitosis gene a)-related kinase